MTTPDSVAVLCVCTLCLPPGLRLSGLTGLISLELNQFPPLLLQSSQSLLSGPQAGLSLGRLSNELLRSRSRLHFPHFLHQSLPPVDDPDLSDLGFLPDLVDGLNLSDHWRWQLEASYLRLESSASLCSVTRLSQVTLGVDITVFTYGNIATLY